MLKHLSYILLIPALLCMAACSTDNYDEQGELGFPDLYITTAPSPIEAEAHPNVANTHELIHHYVLVYVNTTTRRVEALQRFTVGEGDAKEYRTESFPIEITEADGSNRHAYRVYAFANFTSAMEEAISFDPAKVGFKLSTLVPGMVLPANYDQAINAATLNLSAYNGYDFAASTEYVPMTAVVDYQATMQYHQPVNVPLVRMLAKLDFRIKNLTGQPISIKKISVRPIYNKEVYVLPHITGQNIGWYPAKPAAETAARYEPQLPMAAITAATDTTHVTLTCGTNTIANDGSEYFSSLYVNESLAKWHPTKHFTFDVAFESNGTYYQYRYALSGNDFTAFCRNDQVIIPLTISDDYSLEPDVQSWPPIGGYPVVIKRKSTEEFYCEFSSEGDFAIYPRLYQKGEDTGLYVSDKSIVESFSISTEVVNGSIFTKQPEYVPSDNAIRGILGTTPGHAIITLTATMANSGRVLTKKVHVIKL